MLIEHWILRDANITYARWHDHIDTAEIRRNFEAYLANPYYQPGRLKLIDLSGVTSSDVGIGGLMMILNKVDAQGFGGAPGILTSILATDDNGYGYPRQFQRLAEPKVTYAFTSLSRNAPHCGSGSARNPHRQLSERATRLQALKIDGDT